ncbi:hypothetical protein AB7B51_17405 [Acinetobacter baumannii]|uniref:hypothetical protein n=1 Tax=Acinetobacter baumannii TaxID=470 RepID=UPI0034E19D1C
MTFYDISASNPSINFTYELSTLLYFSGEVATAIRLFSLYTGDSRQADNNPYQFHYQVADFTTQPLADLMYLSDVLHYFSGLHQAIKFSIEIDNYTELTRECNRIIAIFESYLVPDHPDTGGLKGDPYKTFSNERFKHLVDLKLAISVLKAIIAKCERYDSGKSPA